MQKFVISATILAVAVMLVLSALDHRFGLPDVPVAVTVVGNVLVAVGLLVAELVVIQNSYAAANTQSRSTRSWYPPAFTGWCDTRCTWGP